ncbi:MAG: V-type ATPase subunit subunit G family protein [Candidatus Delongbacteria bacterium]
MEKKLQELTEKIYSEGVEKAKKEADKIISDAKKEADKIISDAKEKADKMISESEKRSEEIVRNGRSEMKLASGQALNEVKQKITDIITEKAVSESIKKSFKDDEFVKGIIELSIKNFFTSSEENSVELTLSKEKNSEMEKYLKTRAKKLLDGELKIILDPETESGFKIGPADGSYKLSFTEEDFENFFKKYLRPKTVELLFGGE